MIDNTLPRVPSSSSKQLGRRPEMIMTLLVVAEASIQVNSITQTHKPQTIAATVYSRTHNILMNRLRWSERFLQKQGLLAIMGIQLTEPMTPTSCTRTRSSSLSLRQYLTRTEFGWTSKRISRRSSRNWPINIRTRS
jgi:hypothetical protein